MEPLKVFILGPARSGTSITYFCMRRVFHLRGRGESHVMPAFEAMLAAFHDYKAKKRSTGNIAFRAIDGARLESHIHDFVRNFYAELYPSGAFVDKTPGAHAIRGIPLIRAVFPEAKIVITKRGGIETVNSFRKKFSMSIASASKIWTSCMEAILWAQENVENVHIIEQFDMTNASEAVAANLCAYLGHTEKTAEVVQFFRETERQKTSDHDSSKPMTLADVPWSLQEQRVFLRLSGDMMRRMAYPL